MAAYGFLPAGGLPACPGAPSEVSDAWGTPEADPVGARRLPFHAALHGHGPGNARADGGADGAGAPQMPMAGHWPLCRKAARTAVSMAKVRAVGMDETSSRRGHDYITLLVDLVGKRLLFATPGKDAKTFEKFAGDLQAHGGRADAITEVSMDLSPAIQKGAKEQLPNAQVIFDRFHLMKFVNEAVDVVRKGEVLSQPDLKKTRWLWLKNARNLKAQQRKKLQALLKDQNLKTAQAYLLRLIFQDIFQVKNRHQSAILTEGLDGKRQEQRPTVYGQSRLYHLNHWDGVLRWFESRITNGILKGFNSLIQSAKAKDRGYRTHKNFINIAYLILGKLDLGLPT